MIEIDKYKYFTIPCSKMTESYFAACSDLFSNNYGEYSGLDNHAEGQPIKLGIKYYRTLAEQADTYVSLCFDEETLVGQAFYLMTTVSEGGKCTWVLQLVVHKDYRNKGIGTRLLQSAWGFSDYHAWGLATTNAITIKTLEAVTWREVNPQFILDNIKQIRELCSRISFVDEGRLDISGKSSQVFTNFYPKFQELDKEKDQAIYTARLGHIKDGYEWLAFTFKQQPLLFSRERFDKILDFSTIQLEDAYSRMPMSEQPWTRHTLAEVSFIIKMTRLDKDSRILDVGCGEGRHSIELSTRGYSVTGIDFSTRKIQIAQSRDTTSKVAFYQEDARCLSSAIANDFDLALCLYDVVGSFRTYDENYAIVKQVYDHLKIGGKAVFSVMNMELTESIAENVVEDISEEPERLLGLPASKIMHTSGDVFDPKYFLLERKNHLVYRKEQFESDSFLSSEYIIADYRFSKKEIEDLLKRIGFNVLHSRYVCLGKWDISYPATDVHAKEIVIVVEKSEHMPVSNSEWWSLILGEKRFRFSDKSPFDQRNPFENDYGRLISSAPVRRLQGKTQVFPLPDNDYPRTRLTHSLEVAYFGFSLGKTIERLIIDKHDLPEGFQGHLPSLLQVAGLVHDIGNTPFGHFGEVAIRDFFKHYINENPDLELTEAERADLLCFDGNVQTFRLLSRLHYFGDQHSYNLTFQTLSALMKYPCDSLCGNKGKKAPYIANSKFGYLQSEGDIYEQIESYFGFNGRRNPVTFILEAADDIAYRAADIEDSVKLNVLSVEEIIQLFEENLGFHKKDFVAFVEKTRGELADIKSSSPSLYDFILAQKIRIHNQSIMIHEVVVSFDKHYQEIMDGVFNDELLNSSDSNDLNRAYKKLFSRVLKNKKILRLEIAGYQAVYGLLELFIPAVLAKERTNYQNHLYQMISDEQRLIFEKYGAEKNTDYEKMLLVTDYISGMTDSFALDLYQRLSGIKI